MNTAQFKQITQSTRAKILRGRQFGYIPTVIAALVLWGVILSSVPVPGFG